MGVYARNFYRNVPYNLFKIGIIILKHHVYTSSRYKKLRDVYYWDIQFASNTGTTLLL